ncbi:GDP-mannose 4,6-dehydratase [Candidatus Uhrbacteria bacterium]|nr:GDP-mannose 4,6-dehydratase [Candidatus Uhrbacteria bacterium]
MFKDQIVTEKRRSFWKDRNVLVTGGFGLLGSHIVELLDQLGANVAVLKRDHVPTSRLFETDAMNRVSIAYGDLNDYDSVYRSINEYEAETVFHVGAQPIAPIANRCPLPTLRTNIMGTCHVMESARLSPTVKRVVVASSDKAYGPQPILPYTEEASLRGNHPYDVSKSCTDLIAYTYHNTYGTPVCVTRCGNLYGPGDLNFNRLVPGIIRDMVMGRSPVIRSDGLFVRDYFFVKDAASAYIALAENMDRPEIVGQAFNFSTGNGMTVLKLVDQLLKIAGSDLEPEILNQAKAEIHDQTLSSAKAKSLLGWEPIYSLDEGLKETIEWYRNFLSQKNGRKQEIDPDACRCRE